MATLNEPQVVDCSFEDVFQPRLAVMDLDWQGDAAAVQPRRWDLPEGISLEGPAPVRFGIFVQRYDLNRYAVRLVWNRTQLAWGSLTRWQLQNCCLGLLLATMRTDFQELLDQPVAQLELPSNVEGRYCTCWDAV
jgi:hypothetical protein